MDWEICTVLVQDFIEDRQIADMDAWGKPIQFHVWILIQILVLAP